MKLIKAYQYVYYKIFKSLEAFESGFWIEWRALGILVILNIFIIFSAANYFTFATDVFIKMPDGKTWAFVFSLIVIVFNYKLLLSKNRWRKIVKEFDGLPKKKNQIGTIIVWSVILFFIINLIFSFYLLSLVSHTSGH